MLLLIIFIIIIFLYQSEKKIKFIEMAFVNQTEEAFCKLVCQKYDKKIIVFDQYSFVDTLLSVSVQI